MTVKPVPLSLRRKSSARLAAVQCLYRLKVNQEVVSAESLAESFMAQWHADKDSGANVMSRDAEPDQKLFLSLLTGTIETAETNELLIKNALTEKWSVERMSPLLLAILLCAAYELGASSSLKPAVILNEYISLTGRFFEDNDVGFVNGILDSLAKTLRA